MKVELSGFAELHRALAEELPKATAKAVLRRTAIKSMERVRIGMADRAPKDEGDLAGSMATQVVKAQRISRTRYAASSGVSVITGPTGREEGGNAAWQENGTIDQPAQPYARPTADAEGMNVIADVKVELAAQINAAKGRIARKAAKRK